LKPVVSIIIVNWNGRTYLPDCLDSLAGQSFRDFEVVLVDNGSVDESVTFVKEHYPWVKLVPLNENTGFSVGNNHGLQHAVGDYIVTLNNDTRVEPDWLEVLVRTADSHPDAGMIGCRICSFDDPDLIDSIGMGICHDGMSRGRFRNRRWSSLKMHAVEEILFPSACAALYRRAMIEQVGFFDDDFFAYAEDSDLGLRGRLAGWNAVVATRAVVYHKYSRSSGSFSSLKIYLVERNHYWVALKNFPPGLIFMLPLFTILRYLEQMRTVLSGSGAGGEFRASEAQSEILKALAKAIFDSLRGLPRMYRKRRQVMRTRRLSSQDFTELLSRYRITFKELLDNDCS
jgi:GT2 family glycosyltransferase